MNLQVRMKWLCVAVLAMVGSTCHAKPEFWDLFQKHYQPSEGSLLTKAQCGTCHVADAVPKRNPFGTDVEAALGSADTLTIAMLQEVESADSDGDGANNGDEISKGSMPGTGESIDTAAVPASAALVPAHSYHPLLVHFPIGIYLFGMLLDILGMMRRSRELRRAASYALIVGSVVSLIAVASGVLAMLRMELAIEGDMLNHLVLGAVATVLSLAVAMSRRKREPEGAGYWLLLVVSGITMAVAGHIGASMVWG